MVNKNLSEIRPGNVEHQGKGNQIVDMFRLIAFFVLFSVYKLIMMMKEGTIIRPICKSVNH
jgi:hypothetical protein